MIKHNSRWFSLSFGLIALLMLTSCGGDNSAEGVADRFLYRYFIELNQQGAMELSTGLAQDKLKDEIELLKSVRSDPDLDLSRHKPFIDYKLVGSRKRQGDTSVALIYELQISSKAGDKFKEQMVLTLTQLDGKWKVANFDTFTANSR